MATNKQLIGGEWVDATGGGTWDLVNPATEEVIEQVPYGIGDDAAADTTAAIDAAAEAQEDWANTNPYRRANTLLKASNIIRERMDDYAKITTEESGKPFAQARAEWGTPGAFLTFMGEEAKRLGGRIVPSRAPGRRMDVTYMPMGVVGIITAWNFPIYNIVRAASAALAAGNSVVVRPSEYTPRTAFALGEALTDAGLPPGVFNVINGDPNPMGQTMLDDPRLRKIQFTGSVRVGKLLMDGASRTVTDLSLELGGNAPVLIFPDADIESVAASAVNTKFRNGGQVCIAPQRFFVHSEVVEQFTKATASLSEQQVVGNGLNPETTLGPLINQTQLERVSRIVADTSAAGGRIVTGGDEIEGAGYFYKPTVIADVPHDSPAMTEEIFGPVMPISQFDNLDDVIRRANGVEVGLAAYVWTENLKTAIKVSEALEFGLVGVNDWAPGSPEAPFGGMKQSGVGREAGLEGLMEYVEPKTRVFGSL